MTAKNFTQFAEDLAPFWARSGYGSAFWGGTLGGNSDLIAEVAEQVARTKALFSSAPDDAVSRTYLDRGEKFAGNKTDNTAYAKLIFDRWDTWTGLPSYVQRFTTGNVEFVTTARPVGYLSSIIPIRRANMAPGAVAEDWSDYRVVLTVPSAEFYKYLVTLCADATLCADTTLCGFSVAADTIRSYEHIVSAIKNRLPAHHRISAFIVALTGASSAAHTALDATDSGGTATDTTTFKGWRFI